MIWKKLFFIATNFCCYQYCVTIQTGTWKEAIASCSDQKTNIDTNITTLKQKNIRNNDKFWLPKAVYKTPWIDNLGCIEISEIPSLPYSELNTTLGECQQYCRKMSTSDFIFKSGTCQCLRNFDKNSYNRTSNCAHVIYQTLSIRFETSFDCLTTTCVNNGDLYSKGMFTPASCNGHASINSGCYSLLDSAHNIGSGIAHSKAQETCTKKGGYLPGYTDSFCKVGNNEGWLTSILWSSLFRTTYKQIVNETGLISDEEPTLCTVGYLSEVTDTIVEEDVQCNTNQMYICEPITDSGHENRALEDKATGVIVGVVFGFVFIISVVVVFIFVSKVRNYGPFKKDSDLKDEKTFNKRSIDGTSDMNQAENVPESHISHIRGKITNDQYAVVDKHFDSLHNAPTINNGGLLYRQSTGEYDTLHDIQRIESNYPKHLYDLSVHCDTVSESGYHSTRKEIHVSHNLDHYDHIASNQNSSDVEYASPV